MKINSINTLGFVFTNYNSSQFTVEAVESINLKLTEGKVRIVIVDNSSSAEQVQILSEIDKKYDNVDLILSDENAGYFRGLNKGIKFLKKEYPDVQFMMIGNNDLIFPHDFYQSILGKIELFDKYPVLSPKVVTIDGEYQNPHVINKISKFRELMYDLYYMNYSFAFLIKKIARLTRSFSDRRDETQHMIPQEIYQGHGSCYILGPLFFQNYEELWAPTFLMGEEFYLSIQLRKINMNVFYEPSISVLHQCHSSLKQVPSKKIWEYGKEAHREYRKYVKTF